MLRVLALSALAIGVTAVVAPAGSPVSGRNSGQIAWKSFARTESTWSIYSANPDGSKGRRLTHPAAGVHDDLPDWSPDGSKIVFERIFEPSSNSPTVPDEIMLVNANGSGVRQIGDCTGDCISNGEAQYSPDGGQIVYARLMKAQADQAPILGIWVMNSDGTNTRQVTQLSTTASSEDHEPAWSPNGKSIVFTRLNDTAKPIGKQALFIVANSGATPRRITAWKLNAGGANWSPDGSKILFQSYRDCECGTSQAYTVRPDGSRQTQLTNTGTNIEPNWSPNGKMIIYAHLPGAGPNHLADLWTMNANGTHKKPIVQTRLWESEPDWGTAPTH